MRLITRRIYRAFPELDSYNDEQCLRFVSAARGGFVRKTLAFVGLVLIFASLLGLNAAIVIGTASALKLLGWLASALPYHTPVETALLVVVSVCTPVGTAVIRDLLLRRRIRFVLRDRGCCTKCQYSLVGLAVDKHFRVACPECGTLSAVDSSLGELVRDQTGTVSYQPAGLAAEPYREWLTPARKRLLKRLALGAAVFVFGVCPLLWGAYELFLRQQAAQAASAMIGPKGFLARVRAAQEPDVGATDPDAWDAFFTAQALRQQVEDDWRSSGRSSGASNVDVPDVSGLMSRALTSQTAEGRATEMAEREAAHDLLDQYRDAGVYEALNAMARRKRAVRPIPLDPEWGPFSFLVPELGQARAFARINGARMVLAFDAGDSAEFADALESNLALSRILARQPLLIDQLVAAAIDELTLRVLLESLASNPSPDLLDLVAAAIDRQRSPVALLEAIENERAFTLECINWVFSEPARVRLGAMSPILRAYTGMNTSSLLRGRLGTRAANIDAANRLFDAYAEEAQKPQADRDYSVAEAELDSSFILLSAVISLPARSLRTMSEAETKMDAVRCIIAIERFRASHGVYPDTLDEIVPDYITQIPQDPWDSTGRPLRYRKLDPKPGASGRGYLLYSVGIDGKDDSGNAPPAVLPGNASQPVAGVDLIFNAAPPQKTPQTIER